MEIVILKPSIKSKEIENRLVVPWSWGRVHGLTAYGQEASFRGDGNILKLNCGDVCTTLSLLKNH